MNEIRGAERVTMETYSYMSTGSPGPATMKFVVCACPRLPTTYLCDLPFVVEVSQCSTIRERSFMRIALYHLLT